MRYNFIVIYCHCSILSDSETMLSFSNGVTRSHDLLLLMEPASPLTGNNADKLAAWVADRFAVLYSAEGQPPHAVVCAPYKSVYAAIVHQHSCNVNAYAENSTLTRRGLVVVNESAAPEPIFDSAAVASAFRLQTSTPPVNIKAIGVSGISTAFARQMWAKLETASRTWCSEPIWLSLVPAESTNFSAAQHFGWLPAVPSRSEPDDDPSSTL